MTAVVEPTRTKGEQTKSSVLSAAIERFGRDGYRATSVADIARQAGVGGSVVYTYFSNKQELFLAALDQDAAGVIIEALSGLLDNDDELTGAWHESLIASLLGAVDRHVLARRVLGGLEPDVTDHIIEISAMTELRAAVAERLARDQARGLVRAEIDPVAVGNGIVTIVMSLLMSVIQVGANALAALGGDVWAVLDAAVVAPQP